MKEKLRLGIIFGGGSAEHEVSLGSARNVLDAIDRERFSVTEIGITKDGRWVCGACALEYLVSLADTKLLPLGMEDVLPAVWKKIRLEEGRSDEPQTLVECQEIVRPYLEKAVEISQTRLPVDDGTQMTLTGLDVVFPVLHGTLGEDGCIQGLLRIADVAVVGCGVLASAVAMDKIQTKKVLKCERISQARWLDYHSARAALKELSKINRDISEKLGGYPVFVKPSDTGSSVGISKVDDIAALELAIESAGRYSRRILIEEAIVGRELEIGILGKDSFVLSPCVAEIIPEREFYDYEAKYIDGATRIDLPAQIDPTVLGRIQDVAKSAFMAIDGCGMARIDFFYKEESDEIFLNEINTIPGFTQISMYPSLMKAAGLSYPELIERLIEIAIERHRENSEIVI